MKKKARLCDPPLEEYNAADFISRLPLEILVSIVSILTLKEAATTCILSRRWRNLELWKLVTTLDFKSDAALRAVLDLRSRNIERNKYINWVNRVIRHHKGPTLDAFMISFDLDKTSKAAIDNWIKFAVTKKVKRLELDFLKYENGIWFFREFMRSYTFPFKLFSGRQSNMAMCTGLRNLRVLSLRCVNVSDRVVEYLLLNCHLLEFLSVHGSDDLVNVKVIGQSLKLNSLEIGSCLGLKTVEIRNTNLASFLYFAPWVRFSIKNFQKPNEVSVGMDGPGVENIEFSKGERNEIILKMEDGLMRLSFNFPR